MMHKIISEILFVLAIFTANQEVRAMESIQLTCKECKFEKLVGEGTTKNKFYEDGLWGMVFFCQSSKEFVHLMRVSDDGIFKKSKTVPKDFVPVTETSTLVEKNSKFHFYTHPSCPDKLIPLAFYKSQEKPTCPICNKGVIEFKTLQFSD